ncbi:MAG TPA: DUF465 domain-containing protein [Thermoanaerobaculia bacterium]|nr:DUF465 domain-containing protein [Thermoanaerobaculia bacterium]
MDHDAVKQDLLSSHDEFRRLHREHQQCEEKLDALREKAALSEADETEEKRIKVHKLALKDRMERLIRDHAAATTV